MDSGFPQPDVDPTPDLLIGAALLAPGFCDDLSTWRLTVKVDGTVLQELHPTCVTLFYDTACIHLRSWIGQRRIDQIRGLAAEIGFTGFDGQYQAGCTDLEQTSITYNVGGGFKRVAVYGPHFLAHEGHREIVGYARLWDLMLEISPYQSTTAKVADESEIRRRLQSLLGSVQ